MYSLQLEGSLVTRVRFHTGDYIILVRRSLVPTAGSL